MKEKDKIFKSYRKIWFDNKLADLGFKKYKSSNLARLTDDDVFQMVNFQKEANGYPEFRLNIVSRPLYLINLTNTSIPFKPGFGIGGSDEKNNFWFGYMKDSIPDESDFELAYNLVIEKAIPFFENTINSSKIIQSFENSIYPIYTWEHSPWLEFEIGITYIRNNNIIKGLENLELAKNNFSNAKNLILREFTSKCSFIIDYIKNNGDIDLYFENLINENKKNLKIS